MGRLDYITRQKEGSHQEDLIFCEDKFGRENWGKLAEFETAESERLNAKLNQARELIIALPNDMQSQNAATIKKQCSFLAEKLVGTQPYAFAVHQNAKNNNLHMHLLFSERQPTTAEREPKIYRQDYYKDRLTGRVCSKNAPNAYLYAKKGDVQRDKDGNIKYKDLENTGFSIKNKHYKSKQWTKSVFESVQTVLTSLGYPVTSHDPKGLYLPQKHVGKAKTPYTARLTAENKAIRVYNAKMAEVVKITPADQQHLYAIKGEMVEGLKQASKTAVNSPQEIVLPRHLNQLESLLERILGHLRDFKVRIDRFLANQKTKQKISKIKKTLQASNLPAYKDYLVLLPDHKAYQVAGPLNKLKLLTKERQYTKSKQSLENKGFFKAFPALAQVTSTKELVKTQRELQTALDDLTRPKPRKRQQTIKPKPIKPKNKESVLGKIKKHQETIRQEDQNIPLSKKDKNLGFER